MHTPHHHQPLSMEGGHPGTSPHPSAPIYPASPPAASCAGMPWARDVDVGLADSTRRLEHCCAQYHIQLSTLPTQTPLPVYYKVRSCHPISLCTPVGHTSHFGTFNLIQGHMLHALLQLALPALCIKMNRYTHW